jgi:hypothetical protein
VEHHFGVGQSLGALSKCNILTVQILTLFVYYLQK